MVGYLSAWERTLCCICNFVFRDLVRPSWGCLSLTVDNWLGWCGLLWLVVDEMWVYLEFDLKHLWRVLLVLKLRLSVWRKGDQGCCKFLNLKLLILPKYIMLDVWHFQSSWFTKKFVSSEGENGCTNFCFTVVEH